MCKRKKLKILTSDCDLSANVSTVYVYVACVDNYDQVHLK